jgi:ribosomal protein S18 acetylase RimI-like enzyme
MILAFRPASPADIPLLRDLADRIWRACYQEMISPAQMSYMLEWMYSEEKIAAELIAGVQWTLVELGTAPVGYLSLSMHPPRAELHKLYLLPEQQGRGFGQQMLAHIIASAAARGSTEIRLRVNKANLRALRAYDRVGFRIVESLVADIGGGFVMDDYVLSLAV